VKRIAVFCALPPNRNTGMATVDLAAFTAIRRFAPQAEITLYTYGKAEIKGFQAGDLPYDYLDVTEHTERYFGSDIFLFWGDFTHTHDYWLKDRQISQQHYEDYRKYIFLTSLEPSRLKDVIVFGSTIITNDAADQNDAAYYDDFKRFFEGVRAVYFRDAISAAKISPLRTEEASLGCDCAFLLKDADLNLIPGYIPAAKRQGVGVFFARTPSKISMMFFARLVGHYLGEKCRWLPWLNYPYGERWQRWPFLVLGFWIKSGHTDTGKVLSSLSGYKFIITDTYHLCVNAWRMGIPAICIGQGATICAHTLSDKKKEVLYEMIGARSFYLFVESLSILRLRAKAKSAAGVLSDQALIGQIHANVDAHRAMGLRRLGAALQALLA